MRNTLARIGVLAAMVGGLAVVNPLPAQACACGGFVSDQQVRVQQEQAVVQLAPGRETVTMQFAATTSAGSAAWVMPVPAHATFSLGDRATFDELDKETAPEVKVVTEHVGGHGGNAAGAPRGTSSPVTVTDHVTIGPYEVAQLGGKDPAALAGWLREHGFTLSPKLAGGLTPYLAGGWSVVAVKITGTKGLGGVLPPFRLAFATTDPVYPMKLSGLATTEQSLRLYVVADHRMNVNSPAPHRTMALMFAGRSDTAKYPHVPAGYLTRYDASWEEPSLITQDVRFSTAPDDQAYRAVQTRYVYVTDTSTTSGLSNGTVGLLVILGVAVLLVVGGLTLLLRRQLRRR